MTENMCHYAPDREQAIVSYLYGDDDSFDEAARADFETHLATCARCRNEVAAFDAVRVSLGQWSPPSLQSQDRPSLGTGAGHELPSSWWRVMPVWAQTAAALLCLGVAASIANLDVRYDAEGLRVRTGWLSAPASVEGDVSAAGRAGGSTPWRADMEALEVRLRADVALVGAAPPVSVLNRLDPTPPAAPLGPEALRQVRALVDEGERRQQRELALRLAEAIRDVNAQRQEDLVRIDRNIGAAQNSTGREMLRQRSEMLNYVTVRTSLQRPQ